LNVIKFVSLQDKAPKEIHAILSETLACFLPGRAKDLSATLAILHHTSAKTYKLESAISTKVASYPLHFEINATLFRNTKLEYDHQIMYSTLCFNGYEKKKVPAEMKNG